MCYTLYYAVFAADHLYLLPGTSTTHCSVKYCMTAADVHYLVAVANAFMVDRPMEGTE